MCVCRLCKKGEKQDDIYVELLSGLISLLCGGLSAKESIKFESNGIPFQFLVCKMPMIIWFPPELRSF